MVQHNWIFTTEIISLLLRRVKIAFHFLHCYKSLNYYQQRKFYFHVLLLSVFPPTAPFVLLLPSIALLSIFAGIFRWRKAFLWLSYSSLLLLPRLPHSWILMYRARAGQRGQGEKGKQVEGNNGNNRSSRSTKKGIEKHFLYWKSWKQNRNLISCEMRICKGLFKGEWRWEDSEMWKAMVASWGVYLEYKKSWFDILILCGRWLSYWNGGVATDIGMKKEKT